MATSPYFYNIIPFTPHFDELSLYFTDEALAHTERIHEKLVPEDVLHSFKKNDAELEFLYTTYTDEHADLQAFELPWSSLSIAFKKRFLNWYINRDFQARGFATKSGFIKDTTVWVPNSKANTEQFKLYSKFWM